VLAVAGAAVAGWGIYRLSGSPFVTGNQIPGQPSGQDEQSQAAAPH
jgi:hypothetical protein